MSAPYYESGPVTLFHGDCIEVMRELPDESVHAVVTDPPYGIRFMGRAWDGADILERQRRGKETSPMPVGIGGPNGGYRSLASEAGRYDLSANASFGEWCREWATECFRLLKPGGHLVSFGGSRTWHRLAAGIEDAGLEIRDSIAWLYGSGFPKSLDVSKAIAKHLHGSDDAFARPEWDGWGTALKPSFEPVVVARKPLQGSVASNVLRHGTGAINVRGSRVGLTVRDVQRSTGVVKSRNESMAGPNTEREVVGQELGRWPANVLLDESQAAELDRQSGVSTSRVGHPRAAAAGAGWGMTSTGAEYDDEGGASRFFPTFRYEAKAPTSERPKQDGVQHPTVKPLDLMRWLVRLVTPPGGTVLEPFAGSGTTLEAALAEGFSVIGIEREADYLPLIMSRLQKPIAQTLFPEDGAA